MAKIAQRLQQLINTSIFDSSDEINVLIIKDTLTQFRCMIQDTGLGHLATTLMILLSRIATTATSLRSRLSVSSIGTRECKQKA